MYRGCRVVQKTPTGSLCLPSAGSRTVLWVEGIACDKLEVREDKQPLAFDTSYVNGGCQLRQKEPSKQPHSVLSLRNKDTGTDFWQLPMDRSKPWLMEWTDRMWRRDSVDLEGTEAELQSQSLEQAAPEVQIDLLMARAVVFHRLGQTHDGIRVFSRVIENARHHGFDSIAYDAATLQWYMLERAGMIEEAWLSLQAVKPLIQDGLSGKEVGWDFDAGYLSMLMERAQDADQYFRRCLAGAERLDLPFYFRYALPYHASVLLSLDRFDDAWSTQQRAMAQLDKLSDCPKSELQLLLANNLLQFVQDDSKASSVEGCDLKQSRLLLTSARELKQKCTNDVGQVLASLAEIMISENRVKDASSYLDEADRAVDVIYRDTLRSLELRAKIAFSEGHPAISQEYFERMERILSEVRPGQGGLAKCKVAIGLWEASLLQGNNDLELAKQTQRCVDAEIVSPFFRRLFTKRVTAVRKNLR